MEPVHLESSHTERSKTEEQLKSETSETTDPPIDENVEMEGKDANDGSELALFKMPLGPCKAQFKKTQLLTQKTTTIKHLDETHSSEEAISSAETGSDEVESQVESPKDAPTSKSSPELSYKVPSWSGMPTKPYSFEVLKSGVIVSTIDLSVRPFTVCGRLDSCDVTMEHPSISRHHAVIQYRPEASGNHREGFYLYDLDSTHGTQLNKNRVKGRIYYALRVGHMLKFGGSSRTYILQGPDEDEEEESSLSVTEIKELRKQEEERLERLQEEARAKREKEDEDEGIDWGMGEDAVEEDDLGFNPFALLDTPSANEELYVNDPKKTLRGWFEREGYDLEYVVEEKGPANFLCRVELPSDSGTGPVYAEATVRGKKKEAVVACALKACRILDRQGLLRQAHHEGRQKKRKNWEENDFYDSDEDTYLDQTGTIEKKRLQRKIRAGMESGSVETYETLQSKHQQVMKEIGDIEAVLKTKEKQVKESDGVDEDSLEAYMMSIKNVESVDKKARTRMRIQLSQLKQEEQKLKKLINIAKPANLPSIPKSTATQQQLSTSPSPTETRKSNAVNVASEKSAITSSEEIYASSSSEQTAAISAENSSIPKDELVVSEEKQETELENEKAKDKTPSSASSVDLKQEASQIEASAEKSDKQTKKDVPSPQKRQEVKSPRVSNKKFRQKYEYDSSNPNYAMWIPPDDQTGDGRTSLNDKYGY